MELQILFVTNLGPNMLLQEVACMWSQWYKVVVVHEWRARITWASISKQYVNP